MVSSRSDTKRRRRDSSPLNSNPKRTKVHAQRKFAQGVSSLSSLLSLTPVKEKSEKSRNDGLNPSGSQANVQSGSVSIENSTDVAPTGKRALPARGAKKPSIEDMITFLCYRGTSALPPHLAHLNKAPSPEPASTAQKGSSETARSKVNDKTHRDGDKGNNKKALKAPASTVQKAVTAAQALKRKYQEQRIKKTTVSSLTTKGAPLLRTTRSNAVAGSALSSRALPKKAAVKKTDLVSPVKKKDVSSRNDSALKKTTKTPMGSKQAANSKLSVSITQASGSRGGLRSSGVLPDSGLRSGLKKLGSNVSLKKKKKSSSGSKEAASQQSKKLATSLSDFSSEDDQPLVKKHKPLVQVQKLIKKSIANIGRKIKMEPRRSKRGLSASVQSDDISTLKSGPNIGTDFQESSSQGDRLANPKEVDTKEKSGKKISAVSSETDVGSRKNRSGEGQRKVVTPVKTASPRVKKGNIMELLQNTAVETEPSVETRSRRGSRDIRDVPSDEKTFSNQNSLENSKICISDSKKKGDSYKTVDELTKMNAANVISKTSSPKLLAVMKSQAELSLSTVLKSPPDLRIPPSIKRPLTAVGITNPMAIAAAAAVVCKAPVFKQEDKGRIKDTKDRKVDVKGKDGSSSHSKANPKNKVTKEESKSLTVQSKSKQLTSFDSKEIETRKDLQPDKTKNFTCPIQKTVDTSDEDSKPIISIISKDAKKTKYKVELPESGKDCAGEDSKTVTRTLRKNGLKGLSDEEDNVLGTTKTMQKVDIAKKSSDDEDFKSSSRTRRLANRSLRRTASSDDEGAKETIASQSGNQPLDEEHTKSLAPKKASNTENERKLNINAKSKLRQTSRSKLQSSEDEIVSKSSNQVTKKATRHSKSFGEDSSENFGSDLSDDASPTGVRASTRSTAKSKPAERKSSSKPKHLRKKLCDTDDGSLQSRSKSTHKSENDITSSDEESDSGKIKSHRIPKTRSKASCPHMDKGALAQSSGDDSDGKLPMSESRLSRSKIEKNLKKTGLRNSSSESASSSLADHDDYHSDVFTKSKKKTKALHSELKHSANKSRSKRSKNPKSEKGKILSDNDSDEGKKKNRSIKNQDDRSKPLNEVKSRRSRSPRRSSRKSIRSQTKESKHDSSRSRSSESSGSSPSQNRRVLRERRGFFSFAEVDPPSDSEEDVIAATKASLEMINQPPSTVHDLTGDMSSIKVSTSESSEKTSSKQSKYESPDVKNGKKVKAEHMQSKKSLSKKRVKPANEVQPNLNEELEKTLLSINLSPQMPKTADKSPEGHTTSITLASSSASKTMASTSSGSLSAVTCSFNTTPVKSVSVGAAIPSVSKQRKSASRICNITSQLAESPVKISGGLMSTAPSVSCSSGFTISTVCPGTSTIYTSSSLLKSISVSSLMTAALTPKPLSVMASVTSPLVVSSASSGLSSSLAPLAQSVSCKGPVGVAAGTVSTAAISSVMATPTSAFSASGPLLASSMAVPMPAPVASAMTSLVPSPLQPAMSIPPASVSAPLQLPMSASMAVSMPMTIPVSLQGSLTTQLGIPMQTSVNVPLSVPMSGTMTLPLQVGSHSSGTSNAAPFLLPVQSTLTPMLGPGQAIIKKESGPLGGMPNPVNTSSLMVGMNPLVVNNNRTYFLSTGSTMSMATSSQQQMVPGSVMPSLLSLRLPDKPVGQQTIMTGSPLFVPFAFGNPGIIQAQGQVQPQIQTVTGVSTITAMATNIQNTVATNIQNSAAPNIQSSVANNIPHVLTTNLQNAVTASIQNAVASNIPANMQGTMAAKIQNTASMASAVTLTQTPGVSTGTGMKQQIVLATKKNGPVSKFILSVGEDGSHVLTEYASSNTVSTSEEGQTLMSVMQPGQSTKGSTQVMNVAQCLSSKPSTVTRPTSSTISPKITTGPAKGIQPLQPCSTETQILKQQTVLSPNVSVNRMDQGAVSNVLPGTLFSTPTSVSAFKTQQSLSITSLSSVATIQGDKVGTTKGASIVPSSSPSSTSSMSVLSKNSLPVSSKSNFAISSTSLSVRAVPSASATLVSLPSSVQSVTISAPNPVLCGKISSSMTSSSSSCPPKTDVKGTIVSPTKSSVMSPSPMQLQVPPKGAPHLPASASSVMVPNKSISPITSSSSISPGVLKSHVEVTSASSHLKYSPGKMPVAVSPLKTFSKPSDLKPTVSTSLNTLTSVTLTSRIPSAPAALAALKSASAAPSSTRAVAKTGSSRKPYSTAPSYSALKIADSAIPLEVKSSTNAVRSLPAVEHSVASPSSSPATAANSPLTQKLPPTLKAVALTKPTLSTSLSPHNKSSSSNSDSSDLRHKSTEVELAPTHRTLSMLSTAFQGNIMGKEKRREATAKKTNSSLEKSADKHSKKGNIEKSGLDSLAEVATTLAERSVEASSSSDKRAPEHSLWTNPAQILGRETLRVPGLPITANVGTNLPTKNELAKKKSGAVLADAVEKRNVSESDKKLKGNSVDGEKPSVSGLLASSKADTPRQKVQKWLDDGSKGDVEHKGNCGLLSNGNRCTCDVIQEDISNLNSLAELCVSMERINSPVKDEKTVKSSKPISEKKKKQDSKEQVKSIPESQSSPSKSAHPLDSHQMKVAWQNAFGVKSTSKTSKTTVSSQPKRTVLPSDLKKNSAPMSGLPGKEKKEVAEVLRNTFSQSTSHGQNSDLIGGKNESEQSRFVDESSQDRKSAQRRSVLGRMADSSHSKLDSSAFSADNESSVYAFEAETDSPPVNRPFRRRSKTLSRSDEEDSTSIGSASNPISVRVSKDPVIVPIQVENDSSCSQLTSSVQMSEKNGICSSTESSEVYYIPIGGQEGNEGDVRAVAVKLGKEGPNNRVVMSAKLVKKPPTFKHPNDSNEEGLPCKRARVDTSSQFSAPSSSQHSENEALLSNTQFGLDNKNASQSSASELKMIQDKHNPGPRDLPKLSTADSSSEDTCSLSHMPSCSKDYKDSRNSMSPASSRNRSPVSDKVSPSASQSKKKPKERLNRQSSIDSDASEKAKVIRCGSKSKSASSRASPSPSLPSTSSSSSGPSRPSQKSNRSYNGPVPGNVSEAPVFYPTEKEFQDPYAYIEKIRPIAEKYGLCRIVAPNSFKPDCNVEDDIRFTADNQYVHKMLDRWGPNAKEMRAIVKYIAQHNIHLKHAPLVGGMELDLPRLYTTVQNFGGLMEVMDKKRWVKVAETMRIPKSAQDRASKLDEVYCKCLLPYETLKTGERDNLFEMVEVEWEMRKERRDKRLAESAAPPGQTVTDAQDDDDEDEEEQDEEEDECIIKGRSMPLTTFFRIARNTTHMWFKGSSPSASEVEHEFWRHVRDRNFHICVNSGSVDCSDPPYGFPIRNSPFAKHPWNLKVFSNSSGSVLRSLGSVIGVTVPTLHFGMVFTTCCWYRDPHGLPWIEYLHTGAKKIWYGIPEHGGDKFRSAMQEVAPHYVRKKALWLASDTAMVPPTLLTERKVPLCRTVQEPGQFIVVFPRAHTSSVATGYIVSESVSFAPPSWLQTAMESFKEMQKCNEPPLFSLDKLIFSIAEDPRTSLNVLNTILPSAMEILEREITYQQELRKKGVNTSERIERRKKKSSGKKSKPQKEAEDMEVMECEVCSTNLYLSTVVNTDDDAGYCLVHASLYLEQEKLDPSQCKLLYTYSQNELHEFCQNLLDRIEAKTGKKSNNFSSNASDSGSSASTSTRN